MPIPAPAPCQEYADEVITVQFPHYERDELGGTRWCREAGYAHQQ